jgi:WD40 repeat protein
VNGLQLKVKPRVFLSYARADGEGFAKRLRERLRAQHPEIGLWQDRDKMEGGIGWWKQIEEALDQVRFLLLVMTPASMQSEVTRKEWRYARQRGVNVYPVKGCADCELDYGSLPNWMRKAHFFDLEEEWETFVNFLKSDRQPGRVAFMAPDLPDGFVQRPQELERLIGLVLDAKRENPLAVTAVLQGGGGYGKTTLAIALCHDDHLIEAFDDGILWVTLGREPNALRELTKVYEALTGEQPDFVDETQAMAKLREKLEDRNCLLVIDDVWQKAHLKAFLPGGKQTCARLITTRRYDILPDTARVKVGEMTFEESVALIVRRMPTGLSPEITPLRNLADRLMNWPLLVKLAAGIIRGRLDHGDTFDSAIDYVNRVYDKRGLIAFDAKDPVERDDATAKSIEASLEQLGTAERTMLCDLVIFPEDTDAPLRMIEVLWGLDDLDTQETLGRLANYSLLDLKLLHGVVRLHDEIRLYLRRAIEDEAALHTRLIDRLGDPRQLRDSYSLRWLPWHLSKAGRDDQRWALLLDFEWIQAKLEGTDIQSLIADYDCAPFESCLHLVEEAIRLSAHVLARDRRQLASQLTGRLIGNADVGVQEFLKHISENATLPWLRPLRSSLTPPDGPLIQTLEGHIAPVNAVAITPDACYAISASSDNTLRIWNLESGETVRTLQGHNGSVNAVAITPDGNRAISASYDNTLRIWDLHRGEVLRTLKGHTGSVRAVAITPDGRRAISASYDRTLRLWDLDNGTTVRTLEGHSQRVNAVAVAPEGHHAVSASYDRTLHIWDLQSGKTLRVLKGHNWSVNALAITPNGRYAISASDDKTLRVWDLESGQTVRMLKHLNFWLNAVAVTPDGRRAIGGANVATLLIWDLESQTMRTLGGHSESVSAVAITPDGRLAVSASDDKTLRVWDLGSGQIAATRESHDYTAVPVTAVAITPDGRCAVLASNENTLQVLDLESGHTVRTLRGHDGPVTAVAITLAGRHAVSASGDKTLRIWELESGQAVRTLAGHSWPVGGVAIASDGRRAVSASDDHTLRIWDLESGNTLRTLDGHNERVSAVATTPDSRLAVSASFDCTLRVWDLETGHTLKRLEGHTGPVRAVAVTPDGRHAVSASNDSTLRVWDLDSSQTVRTLTGHISPVKAVAVTPDGRHVVSASFDLTLRLWDLNTGMEITSFVGDAKMSCCAVSPLDRKIIAGDEAGTVHVLQLQGIT